jgi:TatD DNase family protein
VPDDRLLIETDSPYLAPVPCRGKRNEPAFVEHTCRGVAAIRGGAAEEVARLTFDNACALYGVEDPP